jgi:hypothetical protein
MKRSQLKQVRQKTITDLDRTLKMRSNLLFCFVHARLYFYGRVTAYYAVPAHDASPSFSHFSQFPRDTNSSLSNRARGNRAHECGGVQG